MATKQIKKRLYWQIPLLLLLLIGTAYISKQQKNMPYIENKGMIFGTTYHITYQNDDDLHKEILAELNKVDTALSTFNPQSIISKINNNQPTRTNELFNKVLVNEWGFGFKKGVEPTKHVIDSLRQLTGYKKVRLVNNTLKKDDNHIMIDCSAIAKGFGSDVVASYLKSKDVKNFMIEIGGEIVTSGISSKRLPWKIGVIKPTDDITQQSQEVQTILNVTDKAMATSGNYRNFYYKGGKKYAHTIDPATGYPVQHNILSSTVIASNCATADAYATAFMVMGLDKAKRVLEQQKEIMAYFIYADKDGKNAVWYSPTLKDKIVQ